MKDNKRMSLIQRHNLKRNLTSVPCILSLWVCLVAAAACLAPPPWVEARSLIYKNYIVRYDRGWDILCEPYVVQKNDWVLKIFRQKGEIAHADFRDFLGIFKRLNPHIKNIDMIRPGQTIDIPLRKLEHGTLPGQASGIVTIPFVTLSKVLEEVKEHSRRYTVRWGDTVSKLIAQHYGRYGTASYAEGIELFKAANPHIKDINLIYAGQQIHLPDPDIREKSWYANLSDEKDDARRMQENPEAIEPETKPAVSPTAPSPVETPAETPAADDLLVEVAEAVGGELQDRGTYFIPRGDSGDFELDMSRHPMLTLPETTSVIFTRDGRIMEQPAADFEKLLPTARVVTYTQDDSVEDIVGSVFEVMQANASDTINEQNEVVFTDGGIQVAVRARWIRADSDERTRCITPIKNSDELTPDSIRRYLEQNGIVLREILPGKTKGPLDPLDPVQRHLVQNVLALAPKGQKDFVQALARNLGFRFAPNVSISFPYAGIQVQAYTNLLSTPDGTEILVDFGDLYGDAITAIQASGPQIIQIRPEEAYSQIVKKLFTALQLEFQENPTFLAAQRPAKYNTSITIGGLLYRKSETQRILLSSATLPAAVADLLSIEDVDVLTW